MRQSVSTGSEGLIAVNRVQEREKDIGIVTLTHRLAFGTLSNPQSG